MTAARPGKRLAATFLLLLAGLLLLALVFPAMALFGLDAIYLIFPALALVAVGFVVLFFAIRAHRRATR
jgi:hypothetical protein